MFVALIFVIRNHHGIYVMSLNGVGTTGGLAGIEYGYFISVLYIA